ncbi:MULTISPECIES: hypothetical protein [unclassified Corynebacterium]|uniref:hypothetical protein n=1 Tax=unclassified Corynebacterium TaxID=2624378 RepID=UPI0029CA6CA0|nr:MULTISPECIES: hypothetical protein [unclassified Corynebacterium]WPF65749.1 hypothetical protein OLX12_09340 [Corynebacterium sp. 22KM0430]WPF68243.1 hypothetical protein OLW90_09335 [Corynebacterium sp. 21KM1197]
MRRFLKVSLIVFLVFCFLCAALLAAIVVKHKYHNRPLESFREELYSRGQARVSDHFDAEEFVFACPYTDEESIRRRYGWDVSYTTTQYDGGPTKLIMRKGDNFSIYTIERSDLNLCDDVEGKIYPARAIIGKDGDTAYIRED